MQTKNVGKSCLAGTKPTKRVIASAMLTRDFVFISEEHAAEDV